MTLTVELKPEVQAELARQAASSGKPVEAYAASLLEEAVHLPAAPTGPPANDLFELFAPVRGLFADAELDFSHDPSADHPVEMR